MHTELLIGFSVLHSCERTTNISRHLRKSSRIKDKNHNKEVEKRILEEGKKKIQRPKGEKYTLICLLLYRHIALHKCYKQKGQFGHKKELWIWLLNKKFRGKGWSNLSENRAERQKDGK